MGPPVRQEDSKEDGRYCMVSERLPVHSAQNADVMSYRAVCVYRYVELNLAMQKALAEERS